MRTRLTLLVSVLLICAAVSLSVSGQSTQPADENLAAENARLRARVRELEAQVQKLEQQRAELMQALATKLAERLEEFRLDSPPRLPPGTRTHPFNGSTFHVIPLSLPAPPNYAEEFLLPRDDHGLLIDDRNGKPSKCEVEK